MPLMATTTQLTTPTAQARAARQGVLRQPLSGTSAACLLFAHARMRSAPFLPSPSPSGSGPVPRRLAVRSVGRSFMRFFRSLISLVLLSARSFVLSVVFVGSLVGPLVRWLVRWLFVCSAIDSTAWLTLKYGYRLVFFACIVYYTAVGVYLGNFTNNGFLLSIVAGKLLLRDKSNQASSQSCGCAACVLRCCVMWLNLKHSADLPLSCAPHGMRCCLSVCACLPACLPASLVSRDVFRGRVGDVRGQQHDHLRPHWYAHRVSALQRVP